MTVLIVDCYTMCRDGLEILIHSLQPNAEVLKAGGLDELNDSQLLSASLLLIEVMALDGGIDDGVQAIVDILQRFPKLVVIAVTAYRKHDGVVRVLGAGAQGFIPKSLDGEVMINAVRLVLSGGVYAPPELYGVASDEASATLRPTLSEASSAYRGPSLTRRQRDVLFQMTLGHSNRKIASELGIAEGTIKIHIAAIFKAMGVTNRTQAVIAANRLGLFPESG